ncbi:hypothetical protein LZ30DRAFT_694583 [Colletotrichum cereale]|nr:hypothetical protein LZ30DRAFT_694583 [Colletotrichum cereale]
MRHIPTGYPSLLEQPYASRSDMVYSIPDSSGLSPQLNRKPVPQLTSLASSELGEDGLGTENRSSTSKQGLLQKSNATSPSSQYHWILEICAVILSIMALAAIAVLLPLYNNKPLSTWSFKYSSNTVVSILGATSRASLAFAVSACISQGKWNWLWQRDDTLVVFDRFEEASRGPWGATVFMVGFEPFLQAIISFEGREVSIAHPIPKATIGKSSELDIGSFYAISGVQVGIPASDGLLPSFAMTSDYDVGIFAAIRSGFSSMSSAEAQTPSFKCSSGNCTWLPDASLSVCSACNDISKYLVKTSGETNASLQAQDDTLTVVGYSAPSYPILVPDINTTYTRHDIRELRMNLSNIDSAGLEAIHRKEAGKEFRENGQPWEDSSVSAQECALYFCTHIYQSGIVQGNLRETILATYTHRNLDSFLITDPQKATESKWYNANTSYSLNYNTMDMNRTDLQLLISEEECHTSTGLEAKQDLQFNITQNAAGSITGLFMDGFARRASPLETKQLTYPWRRSGQLNVIDSLGISKNLTATFETVAASMSKYIRDLSLETEPKEGETQNWVVFIRVEWGFLSLPFAALLGGCLFCLLSIAETKRLGLPAWRGSSLAGLAQGLDTQSREQLREADAMSQMNAHANLYKVWFVDSDLGPELKPSENYRRNAKNIHDAAVKRAPPPAPATPAGPPGRTPLRHAGDIYNVAVEGYEYQVFTRYYKKGGVPVARFEFPTEAGRTDQIIITHAYNGRELPHDDGTPRLHLSEMIEDVAEYHAHKSLSSINKVVVESVTNDPTLAAVRQCHAEWRAAQADENARYYPSKVTVNPSNKTWTYFKKTPFVKAANFALKGSGKTILKGGTKQQLGCSLAR